MDRHCRQSQAPPLTKAGFVVPTDTTPIDVSLLLREKGWTAYRIRADYLASVWIATIIDWNTLLLIHVELKD